MSKNVTALLSARQPESTNPENEKTKEITSYCNMSLFDAEKRLGVRLDEVQAISIEEMLATTPTTLLNPVTFQIWGSRRLCMTVFWNISVLKVILWKGAQTSPPATSLTWFLP